MRRLWRWLVALAVLAISRMRRPREADGDGEHERIVPEGSAGRRAEVIVLVLLGLAILAAAGFVVVYAVYSAPRMSNVLLGLSLGLALVFAAVALTVVARRLVVTEEIEDDYPQQHENAQLEIVEIVRESGSRFTRKRLLMGAGAGTGLAIGIAALTPALSLGPLWFTDPLDRAPWRRGVRLVDEKGVPLQASAIDTKSFYTAFPEGANREEIGSPVVVVRVDPASLRLPPARAGWAPQGIVAYSQICTHAGCAIALYRTPKFAPVEPNPELVCPCHYSTFDPAQAGAVTFGPAGRPLPQLPLEIDAAGFLRATGNFSERVGPSWWNVREQPT